MFTNLFGNFLNVKEHFEMFQWNNQKYFQTNSSENILKCSKLFFRIFLAIIQYIVSCSQTFFHLTLWNVFKLVREHNILKSSKDTYWNVSKQIILKSFFPNISSNYPEHCELFSNIYSLWHFWMFMNILKSSNGTFWNFLNVHEHFKNFQWNILNFLKF